jgi:hypothetical protein
VFQNHKKHVAATAQQLASHRKSPDPTLASKISDSLETISGEEDSNMCISEASLKDACSVNSNLEQEVVENYTETDHEHITTKYSAHPITEKAETADSTCPSTDRGTETNVMQNNVDKVTKISTSSHSDLKQETAGQRNDLQFSALNSKSDAVSSQTSDSIPCDPETVTSQFYISHAEFPRSDSASTDLTVTK